MKIPLPDPVGTAVAGSLQKVFPSSEQRRLSLLAAGASQQHRSSRAPLVGADAGIADSPHDAHLPLPRRSFSIPAGSAAGVSAGFGAPIAGAFFAVEAVLQPSSSAGRASDPPSLTSSMVLLSAVLATVVSRAGLGSEPTFTIPDFDLSSITLLPLYLPLGLLSGVTSVLFTRASSIAASAAKKCVLLVMRCVPLAAASCRGVLLQFPSVANSPGQLMREKLSRQIALPPNGPPLNAPSPSHLVSSHPSAALPCP